MRYDLFSGNCERTVAGYHLLLFGSMYMTFWPMGMSYVGEDNILSLTWRISAVSWGAWLIPIYSWAACDRGRFVWACLPCKICIDDCKVPFKGVFLYTIRAVYGDWVSSLALWNRFLMTPTYFSASPLLCR